MTETPGAQTQAAKAAARKRSPRQPKAQAPQPEPQVASITEVTATPDTHVMSRPYPNVHELWSRVMESVRSVAKGDFNQDQGFKFRGVDAVVDAVGPALRQHKVHIRPRKVELVSTTEYTTKRGARMVNRVVKVKWKVTGPQGDSFVGESVGEAADAGDKSLSKAQSVAYRMYLLQALAIPTGESDPDADAHERDTPAANEGYYWDQQQERQYSRQRPPQPQQSRSDRDNGSMRQERAGEENQAAPVDNAEARKELWVTAKGLGWEWNALAARFKSDYGMETKQADAATIESFMGVIIAEAQAEEDRAIQAVQEGLGGKPIDEAQTTGGVL